MKITVVTVAWNAGATIADTLGSVAAQTGVEVEHLIIDGGSTDDTLETVRRLAGPHVVLVSEPDKGLYDAMNKGLARATGELVGFLNADDFFCRTDALAILAEAAHRSGADAVGAGIAIVRTAAPWKALRAYPARGFRPWMLHIGHQPPHPGFYVRRAAIARVGPYDAEMRIAADFDWMMRFFLVARLRAEFVAETITAQREGGASQTLAGVLRARRETHQALRRAGRLASRALILGKYPVKAAQIARRPVQYPAPPEVRWFPEP